MPVGFLHKVYISNKPLTEQQTNQYSFTAHLIQNVYLSSFYYRKLETFKALKLEYYMIFLFFLSNKMTFQVE